jgi:hypothetical protein
MIKYIKVEDATEALEKLELGKVRLDTTDENGGPETPWVKTMSDGRQVLQNHAINFHPFPSWGMVLPAGYEQDITGIRDAKEFPLHPEAYDKYVENGIIDAEGMFITPEPKEQEG